MTTDSGRMLKEKLLEARIEYSTMNTRVADCATTSEEDIPTHLHPLSPFNADTDVKKRFSFNQQARKKKSYKAMQSSVPHDRQKILYTITHVDDT